MCSSDGKKRRMKHVNEHEIVKISRKKKQYNFFFAIQKTINNNNKKILFKLSTVICYYSSVNFYFLSSVFYFISFSFSHFCVVASLRYLCQFASARLFRFIRQCMCVCWFVLHEHLLFINLLIAVLCAQFSMISNPPTLAFICTQST